MSSLTLTFNICSVVELTVLTVLSLQQHIPRGCTKSRQHSRAYLHCAARFSRLNTLTLFYTKLCDVTLSLPLSAASSELLYVQDSSGDHVISNSHEH